MSAAPEGLAPSALRSAPNTYPNPVGNVLHIDGVVGSGSYRLLNIVGAAMQQGTLKAGNNNISLLAIPNGLYMLEITDDEGQRWVRKLVKQ